ncbi:unnamed protein product [Miscanthus lutarioriparius]|uniref:Uncharacterized protein n=1 Tax=Miscanthus lutarioriparius TaxID=422564 RepID=A0A811MFW2_9POAL|nr:unnamed protein product [Miscanthus lutarioriparius]
MAAAAPGAAKDGGVPQRWEDVFDNGGDEEAMELFMTLLLRDARAEYAQQARKEEEEEERRARVFEPWQPPPPGSALPPPVAAPPRVERTVVLGLRAPPHLLPRKHEKTTTTTPGPAADLGRPAKNTRGGL